MARLKKNSDALTKAEKREAGLRTITDSLSFNDDANLEGYSQLIQDLRTKLSTYHSALTTADDLARDVKATEQLLRKYSEKMLLNVAARYGKDSREYGKAGGVLTSERKKRRKSPAAAPKPPAATPAELVNDPTLPVVNLNEPSNGKEVKIASMNGNGNGNGNGKTLAV
jgi:hypothetical protein